MQKTLAAVFLALFLAFQAHANPALHGTWSTAVNNQPLVVALDPGGTGKVNGQPMQWQVLGPMLFVQMQGGNVYTYGFSLREGKLHISGGDLAQPIALTPGTKEADAARAKQPKTAAAAPGGKAAAAQSGGNGQELVGKWCDIRTFNAGSGGSSSRMACFELRPDGTYTYNSESSRSVAAGSTASQSGDSGRWRVSGNQLTAQSNRGTTNTYTLEKRNHPKNKRDPMICLDGQCYVTYFNKPAW